MSRQSKVGFGIPTASRARSSVSKAGSSKSSCAPCPKPSTAEKKSKFKLPALSVPFKERPIDPVLEKLRKKTIRRNAPQGEDIKKIREVIKGMHNEAVTVQEYVGLISPYTGDTGNILRTVMGDDLSSFRKMAKRVYDTMTQDVSDVLANEQIHLTDYYNERYNLFMEKMMRAIDEIFQYCPNFDFETYYQNPQEYLDRLFPLPRDSTTALDPEEEEMHRRQEAYHRLQWLRSEGTRLAEENAQLQARLKELKREQQEELSTARKHEELAEVRKSHLEATQAQLQNHLQELNESVEKSFITTEEEIRHAQEAEVMKKHSKPQVAKKRTSRPQVKQQPSRGQSWNVRTAKVIEDANMFQSTTSALSSASIVSTSSKGGTKKKSVKSKMAFKRPPPPPRDKSPFHFSPIKTPPKKAERDRSPFHYSPPKTPPTVDRSRIPNPHATTTRMETSSTVIEQQPSSRLPAPRRNRAPRDSWGGYG